MLDVKCPVCQAVYHSDEANIGRSLRCSRCGSAVPILREERSVVLSSRGFVHRPSINVFSGGKRRKRIILISAFSLAGIASVSLFFYARVTRAEAPVGENPPSEGAIPQPPPGFKIVDDAPAATEPKFEVIKPPPALSADQVQEAKRPSSRRPIDFSKYETEPSSGMTRQPRTPPRPEVYNSPATGSLIEPGECRGGHGVLTVQNGTNEDAVARLYDPSDDQTICWFFVRRNDSASKTEVPEGYYRLAFTMGLDWIESEDTFRWQPSYGEFDRGFRYSEERDYKGIIQYHDISVTLQPVKGGNVRTRSISRREFLRGHHHLAVIR